MDTNDGGASAAAGTLDEADAAFFSRSRNRCCCFSAPWQSSSSSYARRGAAGADGEWWHQVGEGGGTGAAGARTDRPRWWRRGVDAFMKVREWSELVAGPRWKTFIRRFRRTHRHGSGSGRKLNYDALSYALNFDEGHGGACCSPDGADGGAGAGGDYPDFTARFAGSTRSSMDLGGRDAPSLFHHTPPQQPRTPPATAVAAGLMG